MTATNAADALSPHPTLHFATARRAARALLRGRRLVGRNDGNTMTRMPAQ